MQDVDRTEQNPGEVLVTASNINFLSWKNYENVIISSCLTSLSEHQLFLSKETLTNLSFWENFLFSNLQICLQHLPNLQVLTFLNINIDESYDNRLEMLDTIEVPSLKSLTIIRDPNIQKDDYILIDFFSRGVTFPNLEKFELRGEDNFNLYSPHVMDNGGIDNWRNVVDTSVIAKFLIKNRSSLKMLELRGPGIVVFESLAEDIQDLTSVQVESYRYSMDNEGANFILNQQNRLQALTCQDYVYEFNIDKMSALSSSIIRNATTLTTILIFPSVLYEELAESIYATTSIDCRIFEQCVNLETLQLNLELMNRRKDWESTRSGRVTNVAFLPHSLRQLNIISERFAEADIEAFGSQVAQFEQLEYICLETSSTNAFTFKFEWIETLYNLPRIRRILFHGARIDDLAAAMDFVNSRPDARGSMINDSELTILLRLQ